jgi:hypothetical protein
MRCARKTLKADSFAALDVATAIGAVTCAVANLIVAKATGAAISAVASVVVATPTGAATADTDAAPDAHAATAVMSVDVDILMSLVLVLLLVLLVLLLLLLLLVLLRLNHVSHFGHGIEELRLSRGVIRDHCGKLYPHPRTSAILAVGRAAFGKGRVGCACDFGAHAWTGAALETVAAAADAITSGAWATTDTVQILEKQVRDYPCIHLLREVCMNGFAFDTLPLDLCLSPVDEFFD